MAKKKSTIKKYNQKKVRIDSIYGSYWLSKFINKFLCNGKKHGLEKKIQNTFNKIKLKYQRIPVQILFFILLYLKPFFGFVYKRLGKEWKKLPIPLEPRRQYIIALTWLVNHIKSQLSLSNQVFEKNLYIILQNFFKDKKNTLIKQRNEYFNQVQEFRINSKFRWK